MTVTNLEDTFEKFILFNDDIILYVGLFKEPYAHTHTRNNANNSASNCSKSQPFHRAIMERWNKKKIHVVNTKYTRKTLLLILLLPNVL